MLMATPNGYVVTVRAICHLIAIKKNINVFCF